MKSNSVQKMVLAALLCAVGIVIPMFSPFKILLEPASYTLGSHVAIMIAMFLAPAVAAFVSLGTALGFFFGGFPLVIVLRAATHVVFAVLGAWYLQKSPDTIKSVPKSTVFSLLLGALHAVCEVAVVMPFYFGDRLSAANYANGFFYSVVLLVGVGTVVHSMIDFAISLAVWKAVGVRRRDGGRA